MASPTSDTYVVASGEAIRGGYYPTIGGGGGGGGGVVVTPPLVPATGAYRTTQQWLLADVLADTALAVESGLVVTPARAGITPAAGFPWGLYGPSYTYVDQLSKWAWVNLGGDWVNTAGVAQATTSPHLSFAANAVTSGSSAYTVNVTAGVQAARNGERWNGYILKCVGGTRAVASQHHATLPAPVINVTYTDATTGTLQCVACVRLTTGTAYTQVGHPEQAIAQSLAIEFERPIKSVASAQLAITIAQHTAAAATINGYLINPPMPAATVSTGVAAAYPGDVGLSAASSILVSHRYQDGSTASDWIVSPTTGTNVYNRANWDPEVLGLGAADTTKLPTALGGIPFAGKWCHKPTEFAPRTTLVASTYTGDGFEPLAPGLGALRIITPKCSDADGSIQPKAGSTGSDLWMLFNKTLCGTDALKDTYVRFYFRHVPATKRLAVTKMFAHTDLAAEYGWQHGKWGIGVHHWTSRGGNNRTGGGGLGWSNRLGYADVPTDMPVAGLTPYVHSLDNIPNFNMYMGNVNGMGSGVYPNRWYCLEVRCKLNTYNPLGGSPSDGLMEVWLDGVKVASHTGWKYRDGPLDPAGAGTDLPPFRQLGPMGLCLNEYMGGTLPADEDRVCFYTAVACGTSYIGPMASAAPSLPSYVPAPGEAAALTTASGKLSNTFASQVPVWYNAFYAPKIVTDYSGGVANPHFGSYGAWICEGAGHFASNNNGVIAIVPGTTSIAFRSLMNGTAIYGTTSAQAFANDTTSDPTLYNGTNWLEYSDGKPASRHSWGALDVIGPDDGGAAEGTFYRVVVGGAGYNGYNTTPPYSPFIPHKMAFATDAPGTMFSYSRAGTLGPAVTINYPYWTAHAKAPGRIYVHSSGSLTIRWFDLVSGTYSAGTGTPLTADTDVVSGSVDGGLMIGLPERNIVLFMDTKSGALRIRRLPAGVSDTNPSWVNTPATLSAPITVNPRWNSAAWVPSIGKLIVGTDSDTGAVYEITVPTVLTDTWTVERVPMGVGQSIPFAGAASISRNYKLWSYLPGLKCIAYFPTPDNTGSNDTLYLYRPRGT